MLLLENNQGGNHMMSPHCWLFSYTKAAVLYFLLLFKSFLCPDLKLNESKVHWIIELYNLFSVLVIIDYLLYLPSDFLSFAHIVCTCMPLLLLVPVSFTLSWPGAWLLHQCLLPFTPASAFITKFLLAFFSNYTEIKGLSVDFHFPLCCDNTPLPTHFVPDTFH